MKKNIFAALMSIVLLFCACSFAESEKEGISVVSTVFPSYDFAKNICNEDASVTMLLPPGTESHSYEPSPGDIVKINGADLIICVGGESESWLDKILESSNKEIKVIRMMDSVDLLKDEMIEGMEDTSHHHGDEEEYDEHVWTSPVNAMKISRDICEALCSIDPENEAEYKTSLSIYLEKLNDLDSSVKESLKSAKRNTVVFGDRFPFRYFFEEYGIEYYAAFPGCSGMTEPGAKTVAFLSNKVKELELPAVFILEFSRGMIAESICESYPAQILRFHSCHNVSAEDFKNGVSYIELMEENLKNLKFALGAE